MRCKSKFSPANCTWTRRCKLLQGHNGEHTFWDARRKFPFYIIWRSIQAKERKEV